MLKDLSIALIQPELIWEDIPANLAMLESMISQIKVPVDLIALPEMFSTGFSMNTSIAERMDGTAIQWMKHIAAERNTVIAGSLMLYEGEGEQRKFYNRIIWMQIDGSYLQYDKRHLFSMSDEPKVFTAGNQRLTTTLHGWRICPMVCYDLRFPVWARNSINENRVADYDVLLYLANWPQRRSVAWNSLLPARAIENLAYVIGVNRVGTDGDGIDCCGNSAAIDPLGEVLIRRESEAEVLVLTLSHENLVKARRMYPFLKDGDRFELVK